MPPFPTEQTAVRDVVVHYRSGEILKGHVTGFSGEDAEFRLRPLGGLLAEVSVHLSQLKAVFFVKDFVGNSAYDEIKAFHEASQSGPGSRMEVALFDGELLVGTVASYQPHGQGFFLVPADPKSNNVSCFVVASAVRRASVI